ncbi:MAG: Hsp70 family protein [Bdellovibrionales bacterium]|nr:Hsp70 family protein [Bdellovibrionales bacterium]
MGMAVGIDLGTTNSAVCVKKLSVSSLLNAENDELTPSVVTAVPIGSGAGFELVVGKPAQYLMKQYPDQTVSSVKRLMGREFDDLEVQNMLKDNRFTYEVKSDSSEPGTIVIPLGEKIGRPKRYRASYLRSSFLMRLPALGVP